MTLSDDDSELSNGSYDSESSDGDCDSESSDEDCNSESQASGSPKRERDEKLAKDDLRASRSICAGGGRGLDV